MSLLMRFMRLKGNVHKTNYYRVVSTLRDDLPRSINLDKNPVKKTSFSKQEMDRRLSALRKVMASSQIDCCIFTSFHNILYYSDFMMHDWGRPSGLLVTHDNSTLITPYASGLEPYRRSHGKNVTYTDWQKDNFFFIVKNLAENVKSVGLEFDHVNYMRFNQFQQALPETTICDVGEATMKMRMIKSEEEIDRLRTAAAIADQGFETCRKSMRKGIKEFELAELVTQTMKKEISSHSPDQMIRDVWTWIIAGHRTDSPHNECTGRVIQKGDILSFNAFPTTGGYYVAIERTMYVDPVPDTAMKVWQSLTEIQEHGISLLRPGTRCCDIANEINALLHEKDLLKNKVAGFGYSKGIAGSYYGREAGLELREYNETALQPNMVLSMMLNNFVPGVGGFRDLDCVVVTQDGPEQLTKAPRGPKHCIM